MHPILSRKGEDSPSTNSNFMNTVKFSAPAFIVLIAWLYLLPAIDTQRVEAPVGEAVPVHAQTTPTILRPSGYPAEPAPAVAPDIDNPKLTAPGTNGSLAMPPAPTQPIDWIKILYPELARISELEDDPAATALAELVPMLASEDPAIRLAAIESVGDMTIAAALPVLSMALEDPDSRVRVTALEALAARDDESVSGNIEPRLYDRNPEVRLAAIDTLAALEARSAVYALASLLSDPEVSIRRHAVSALGDIGGESAMRYLLQARFDPDQGIRINADAILAESNQ